MTSFRNVADLLTVEPVLEHYRGEEPPEPLRVRELSNSPTRRRANNAWIHRLTNEEKRAYYSGAWLGLTTRPNLSARQIEVLRHVSLGNSARQTATAMYLSEATIKNHRTAILNKLGAKSMPHAVALALGARIIPAVPATKQIEEILS